MDLVCLLREGKIMGLNVNRDSHTKFSYGVRLISILFLVSLHKSCHIPMAS